MQKLHQRLSLAALTTKAVLSVSLTALSTLPLTAWDFIYAKCVTWGWQGGYFCHPQGYLLFLLWKHYRVQNFTFTPPPIWPPWPHRDGWLGVLCGFLVIVVVPVMLGYTVQIFAVGCPLLALLFGWLWHIESALRQACLPFCNGPLWSFILCTQPLKRCWWGGTGCGPQLWVFMQARCHSDGVHDASWQLHSPSNFWYCW